MKKITLLAAIISVVGSYAIAKDHSGHCKKHATETDCSAVKHCIWDAEKCVGKKHKKGQHKKGEHKMKKDEAKAADAETMHAADAAPAAPDAE